MKDGPNIARVAGLIGDPARAEILTALLADRALTATELAVVDPENAGPRTVRETGRLCYWSANRAVIALGHLWRYSRHRARREREA